MNIGAALVKRLPLALALLLAAVPVAAQPTFQGPAGAGAVAAPRVLLATWGTERECRRREHPHGSPSSPVAIGPQWLRQGFMHCLVTWLAHQPAGNGSITRASVRCGEDGPRDYRVLFDLRDGSLRIRWSPDFTTPPLRRCE